MKPPLISHNPPDRYQQTFSSLKKVNRPAFCPFAVLGHPTEKESLERIKLYLKSNPDILELGIPFSDPVADGPIIQIADEMAIQNEMTPKKCMDLIQKTRSLTNIPIGILTYANIVLQYDIEKFYCDLKKAGGDSILIADVPLEEIEPFAQAAKHNNIHQIFIISENTSITRLKQLQKYGSGFFYVVSSLGVTGTRDEVNPKLQKLIQQLKKNSKLPLMIGFGISTPSHIQTIKKTNADGLIIGSALVKTPTDQLPNLLKELSNAYL